MPMAKSSSATVNLMTIQSEDPARGAVWNPAPLAASTLAELGRSGALLGWTLPAAQPAAAANLAAVVAAEIPFTWALEPTELPAAAAALAALGPAAGDPLASAQAGRALGLDLDGLRPGQWLDALVLDPSVPAASPWPAPLREVIVGGRSVHVARAASN